MRNIEKLPFIQYFAGNGCGGGILIFGLGLLVIQIVAQKQVDPLFHSHPKFFGFENSDLVRNRFGSYTYSSVPQDVVSYLLVCNLINISR
jgi:hypothetical protein